MAAHYFVENEIAECAHTISFAMLVRLYTEVQREGKRKRSEEIYVCV